MVVYIAIAAMLIMMGGIVLYAGLDNPELEMAEIDLVSVQVVSEDKIADKLKIEITFLISNPGEKTFTIPLISYDLFADGALVASGQYSTEDIAMPGRAAFYPSAEIPLKSTTIIEKTNIDSQLYEALVNEEFTKYSATGILTIESAWSVVEKEFKTDA